MLNHKQHITLLLLVLCTSIAPCVYCQDTIHLNKNIETAQVEDLLWQLLQEQAIAQHQTDSLRQDSLYKSLLLQERELSLQLNHIRDSIDQMRPTMPQVKKMIADSIDQAETLAMREAEERLRKSALDIAPALVYDAQEDMQEIQEAIRNRKSPWRKEFNLSLQFTQNYISPNWYKGGNSNFAALGIQKAELWYDQNKLNWYTLAEWRLGATTVTGDSLRKVNITDDLFRIYSKVGYKVHSNLNLSSSVDLQTNFFEVWNSNQHTAKTATFTPLKFNYTIGIDYKPIKNMSIVISPLAYKLVYAMETDIVDVTKLGIEEGSNILNDLGSSIRLTYKWQPLREIKLDTEFYFYTNYKKVEIDWEVNCHFIINRFLTTRLTLHPRFDSTVLSEKDDKAHIQFKELLSIGFAHRFK